MRSDAKRPASALKSGQTIKRALLVAQGVIVLVLAGLAWDVDTSVRRLERVNELHLRSEHLRGAIVYLDEVLTMSARMGAATGDPRWEARYREFDAQLGPALQEALALAPRMGTTAAVRRTQAANAALVQIENGAFALVHRNDLDAARAALSSAEYDRQKGIYAAGMDALDAALEQAARRSMDAEVRRVRVVEGTSIAMLGLLGLCWVVAVRAMNRRNAVLTQDHERLARLSAELEEHGATLDVKVAQRTRQLAESEARYRALVDEAGDIIYGAGPDGRFTFANPAAQRALGRGEDEILGQPFTTLVHPSQREEVAAFYRRQLEERTPFTYFEFLALAHDGRGIWLGQNVQILSDAEQGDMLVAIARDITAQKQAELALAASEEKFRSIVETTTDWIWAMDGEGRLTYGNPATREVLGYSPEELLGRLSFELLHPEDRPRVEDGLRRPLVARPGWSRHLLRWRHRDGSYRFLEGSSVPVLDEQGRVAGWRGVDRDVTESRRLQEELRLAKEAAEAANRAKSEFLANMSHEIRTPMNGIVGMTELLLGTSVTREQREYLQMVRESADRLLEVINDILDFSKVEAGRLELDAHPFGVRDTVAQTARALGGAAEAKGLELSFRVAPDVPDRLVGDDGRLRQVLVNLVSNAIKFTERGQVSVEVEKEWERDGQAAVHVVVRDTGLGIAPERREAIFSPFTQADGTTTRRYGGTGLGLSISSQLALLMGGRMWVESVVGEGSAFHFTARFGLDEGAPAPSAEGRRMLAEVATVAPAGRPLRVLVAEDNKINQHLVVATLEKRGHSVVLVVNGREAVAAAHRGGLDVALLDVQMPEMDGFQATAAIRAAEKRTGRHLPIVALTARALKGDREACLAAGMDDYLSKPIRTAELLSVLERLGGAGRLVSAASTPEPAFDPRDVLARVEGDRKLLAELVDIFRVESPRLLAGLRRCLEAGDVQGVEHAAHAVRGSVGNFGGHAAAEAALILERMGREAALSGGMSRLAELEQEVARLASGLARMSEEMPA
ncbi:MAG TPA: PAS domain S-box protein [Candidatus Binatia bacterium]|nr:PAS domain S-box protein [Candidatus Binatia bacterium]